MADLTLNIVVDGKDAANVLGIYGPGTTAEKTERAEEDLARYLVDKVEAYYRNQAISTAVSTVGKPVVTKSVTSK